MEKETSHIDLTGNEILNLQSLSLTEARRLLHLKHLELDAILEVTQAINSNKSTKTLFQIYEYLLRTRLGVKIMAVYLKNTNWECVSSYGVNKKQLKIDVEKDLLHVKDILLFKSSDKFHDHFEAIIPVYHKNIPLAYILIGDYAETLEEAKSDIRFVQTISNIICVAIENKKLVRRQIQQEGVKKEIELAAQMQNMLFPSILPNDNHLEMAAIYLPHRDIGGDYYDFIRLNNHEVVFCIADVSGKGFAAGLLMANFQANFHTLLLNNHSLVELVEILNTKVLSTAKYEKFITFFVGKYHIKDRLLQYVNAGHNPPLLYSGKQVHLLNEGCTVLGMFDKMPYIHKGEIRVNDNAILVCYTDGIIEVENRDNQPFEVGRLTDFVTENAEKNMREFNQKLISEVNNYKGDNQFTDDITLLSCRII